MNRDSTHVGHQSSYSCQQSSKGSIVIRESTREVILAGMGAPSFESGRGLLTVISVDLVAVREELERPVVG